MDKETAEEFLRIAGILYGIAWKLHPGFMVAAHAAAATYAGLLTYVALK